MKVQTLLFASSNLLAAAAFTWTGQPQKYHGRLAIARTFVAADFDKLVESFQKWPHPCQGGRDSPDLFLVYSGDLAKDEELRGHVEDVTEVVGAAYSQCFRKVEWFSCFIPKEVDIYEPHLQHERLDWVNGPNRQFEITYRKLQSMGYGSMFLMEADTVPLKPFWLDLLQDEIEAKLPFSLLGSQYKGDKWDSFRKLLPEALLRHINGNAVYNLKDPLLDRIVQQLEREVNTTGNGVPYDYRIAQIVIEGKEGVVADLPTYPGVADPVQQEALDYVGFDDSSTSTMLKTTKLVGNYADTNMIAEYFPHDEVFVHGARMFQSWKMSPFTGSLTLVVSDYTGETPYKELLGQVNQIKTLPFHRLLLAVPYAADISILEEVPIDLPVDVFDREPFKDSLSDYCDVLPSLKTEWFMLTDSHVRMMSKLSLMVTEDEGKPLVSFVDSDVAKCYQDDFCREDLLASQMYVPGNDRVFRNDDTVFSVAAMKEYCATLGDGQERHRPSATGYFAFLESSRRENGGASTMYAFSDRAKRGSRLPFRKYLAPTELDHATPSSSLEMRRFLKTTNTTECEDKVTELECEATVGCVWDNDFGSCKDMPTIIIIIIIVVSPVDLLSPTAPDQIILINALRNFVSTEFRTIAQASITTLTFRSRARRSLAETRGDFTINYELSIRLTDVLNAGNAESAILQALTANADSIANGIAETASREQGPSSSLDLVDTFAIQSVKIKDDKEETCDGTGGFMFFFCIIAKAFGSFAGFIKWIVNFLSLGIFS